MRTGKNTFLFETANNSHSKSAEETAGQLTFYLFDSLRLEIYLTTDCACA